MNTKTMLTCTTDHINEQADLIDLAKEFFFQSKSTDIFLILHQTKFIVTH